MTIDELRVEYKTRLGEARTQMELCAQHGTVADVSEWSSAASRYQEVICALDRLTPPLPSAERNRR